VIAARVSSIVEGSLDGLTRLVLRAPWPPNGRIVVQGVLGFLMQILRSRALGLQPSGRGHSEARREPR
jgi:hypothetical protein